MEGVLAQAPLKQVKEDPILPPGIIGSLKQVAKQTRDLLAEDYQRLISANEIISNPTIDLVQKAEFDSLFLKSLFLHSQQRYLDMITYNPCHFFALLENGLLKTSLGEIKYLLMNQNGKKFLVETKSFTKEAYKVKCQTLGQISQIFNIKTLKKTVSSLNFPVPKTKEDCGAIFEDWKKNDYLPYLCAIPHKIKEGKRSELKKAQSSKENLRGIRTLNAKIRVGNQLSEELDFFQRSYLSNLCSGIENIENFCQPYLARDAWSRIINGEIPSFYLDFKCKNLYGKETTESLSRKNILACAKKVKEDPKICTEKSAEGFSSLFPRPNCSLISKAINESTLNVDYHDCPGQVDNGAVTNIHRILNHFFKKDMKSTPATCKAEANYSLKEMREKSKNISSWPLKICYDDKIENKEVCKDYIPGSLEGIPSSEDKVVTRILRRTNKMRSEFNCQVISSKKYNPALLEYKNGCHIVFNEKKCSDAYCPRKIIVDEKEVKGLTYTGKTQFDYFPNNWKDQNKSAVKVFEEVYKIKSRKILNLTQLEIFLRQHKQGIIHGISCAEDMLPRFFKRKVFNQCTPLTFILDGVIDVDNNKVLVTRSSYDDLHSPRLIPWNWIFTGVMKYQAHHPLNQWNLYGLYL